MDDIKGRLRFAIGDGSIREFHRRLEKKAEEEGGIRGSSYAMVHKYLSPDTKDTPPLEFLVAAAEILDVRPAWLILGEGQITEAERGAEQEVLEQIAVLSAASVFRTMAELTGDWWPVTTLRHVLSRLVASLPEKPTGDEMKALVQSIEHAVLEPMRAVAPHQPGKFNPIATDPQKWHTYALAVLSAMDVALRGPAENVSAEQLLARAKAYHTFDQKQRKPARQKRGKK